MDFSEAGTWSLKVDPDFVTLGQQRLGLDAFDHLAFVVKQGNKSGKHGPEGFAVYDFNFQQFIDQNILDQSTAYNFYGSFDLTGIHGTGFSHVSVWARDPVTTATNVPAPATLALFALGLFGLGWSRRKQKA
ncbi:PEP-CTERM sorting domain-containing protein [Parahaliea sp. F7430]|uniref:PEP-CTERM sorting domain-containing protein n=2 Tax=Sediminihaliea albiluteola TaxID=2758564 RepID=A0A7W2TU64_9GAMM|nr:PEP-CTERM sorting domain-containing protein [Sediminihaliea albiluteola]